MKNYFWLFCLLTLGCSKNPESYLPNIEGYWEISEVTMPDGSKKEYRFNESVDYISLSDSLSGFRKKLKPGINNKYVTSDDVENLTIKIENDSLNIYYSTAYANWKETVLDATPESLKVINQNDIIYVYKKHEPIILDMD